MFGLVVGALRARRAQAVWLAVLATIAVAGASAAPWYHAAALASVTDADLTSAPAAQRTVLATGRLPADDATGSSPLPAARQAAARLLDMPGATVVLGAQFLGTFSHGDRNLGALLAYRDDVCAHLHVDGACPAAADEVVMSAATAEKLGVTRGDEVDVVSLRLSQQAGYRVVGIYEPVDLDGTYWAQTGLLTNPISFPAGRTSSQFGDAVFTTEPGLLASHPGVLDVSHQAVLSASLFTDASGGGLTARLARALAALPAAGYAVQSSATTLAHLVDSDRWLTTLGVVVAAVQLLLLCWFCLFLVVRASAEDRRGDIGLLKLRGSARWRVRWLSTGQSALPVLTGGVLGWVLGYPAAWALALIGGGSPPLLAARTTLLSLSAAALVMLGALMVATAAERRALRTPVVGLLRRVPSRRAGWRADLVDLIIAALAVVGIYQAWADRDAATATPLALLTPGLLSLVLGLFVARMLPVVAGRMGTAMLRAGRVGPALAGLDLSRRPGTNRVLALLIVAVALLCTATLGAQASAAAAETRARQSLGAERVLTVVGASPERLLGLVRRADPDGRYAMAVVSETGDPAVGTVLAVDASRLARVALWQPDYGVSVAEAARLLRAPAPPPTWLTDGAFTLDARVPNGLGPTVVNAVIAHADGARTELVFGPVTGVRRPLGASLTGCPASAPCRLVGFRSVGPAVELYELDGPSGVVVAPETFGDMSRWRPALGSNGSGIIISPQRDMMVVTDSTNPGWAGADRTLYLADGPIPLPMLLAGNKVLGDRIGDDRISPVSSDALPYRVAATLPVLPRLGNHGALVDLEAAVVASVAPSAGAAAQVWLAPDAPSSIVDKLTDSGLTVVDEDSVRTETNRFASQGPASALRYLVFSALAGLLLAAGSLSVSVAVDSRPRAAELGAMRVQGLPGAALRLAANARPAVLVPAAVVVGAFSSVLARVVIQPSLPVFTDGWRVLPIDTGPRPVPLLLAIGVAAVVLVGSTVAVTARMVRAAGGSA